MEYRIIASYSSSIVEEVVSNLLAEGWQLYGELKIIPNGYAQALIKNNKTGAGNSKKSSEK